jgi:Na+-driven multidrug efflux pump
VAIALLAVLGVLMLVYVVLIVPGREGAIDSLVAQGQTRAEAEQYLTINTASPLVLGVLFLVSAVALSLGRGWARWTGVVTAAALAGLVLYSILTAGLFGAVPMLLFVLPVAAAASLLARATAEWLARPAQP